uniref:Uncharacterized protein n=1 Tax=Myoviridae sp. ctkfK18 TaxID=2825165 RepID=A0A8S5VGF3_9CAUD|nr:MAG TPA: hypothetical protein [Myoviridae sp. ctkfK18]
MERKNGNSYFPCFKKKIISKILDGINLKYGYYHPFLFIFG